MPSTPLKKSRAVTLPLLALFFGLFFVSVIALPPGSRASLQSHAINTSAASRDVAGKRRRPEFVPGQALVRFKKGKAIEGTTYVAVPRPVDLALPKVAAAPDDQEQILTRIERFAGSDLVEGLRLARVNSQDTLKAIAALKARPDVMYAEPNYIVYPADTIPNDLGSLYGLTKIGAPQAWDITTGSSSIVVGVVDEGMDVNHPDLAANVWVNPGETAGNGIDDDGNGLIDDINGWDFFHNDNQVFDYTGITFPPPAPSPSPSPSATPYEGDRDDHGTHVAGTIGATGNNGTGVVGVNWQVKMVSLKFIASIIRTENGQRFETFEGSSADAISSFSYAKQMHDLWISSGGTRGANIRVLNNSWGGGGFEQAMADAISNLSSAGILFVAAGGNIGPTSPEPNNDLVPHYPSSYDAPNLIAVAATGQTDSLAGFSHYGLRSVHLGAPGVGILSTMPKNTYGGLSGTSMATPHVAGAAALICAAYPNISLQNLRGALLFNGDVVPALQGKTITGRRLNAFKSLQAAAEGDISPPGTVSNLQITSQNGRSVNLSWTASGDDGSSGQAALYDLSFTDTATNAVVPLTTLIPPTTGTPQSQSLTIPYRHTSGTLKVREFDNLGNEGIPATIDVNVDLNIADPYTTSLNSPAALSGGGLAVDLKQDDAYKSYTLPFGFPYFGQIYNTVTISSNGALYFSPRTGNDAGSSTRDLSRYKMIAGLWDDIDLRTSRRPDADVYVKKPDATRIVFRWQGVDFDLGNPVNFEIELRADGTVKTRYGSGNTNLRPVVGISAGEPDAYVIDSLSSDINDKTLTDAQSAVFNPRVLRNPIDDHAVFVAQHYFDFLNRAPDDGGLAYWLNEIMMCGNDLQCIEARRIAVSDAFFFEPEYQRSGAYVFRIYRLAFGNAQPFPNPDGGDSGAPFYPGPSFRFKFPSYAKFSADRLQVIGGSNLTQLQINFANAFVQRPEFVTKYPLTLTRDEFVDAVLANIQSADGADLSSQRAALQALHDQGGRGAVVYRLADDDAQGNPINNRAFIDAEYNLSFIMNEYAAYLRRDGDANGMNFWLIQVNSGPLRDAARQHAMVCSFITSQEYQQRFSPVLTRTNALCSGV